MDSKNEFELAIVNEPSVFESSMLYCSNIINPLKTVDP